MDVNAVSRKEEPLGQTLRNVVTGKLSIIGRNLLHAHHAEFNQPLPTPPKKLSPTCTAALR